MGNLIKSIKLDGKFSDYSFYEVGVLNSISKINIFVGPNNSGKSRFLRMLASLNPLYFEPHQNINAISTSVKEFRDRVQELFNGHGIVDYNGILVLFNGVPHFDRFLKCGDDYLKNIVTLFKHIDNMNTNTTYSYDYKGIGGPNLPDATQKQLIDKIKYLKEQANINIQSITAGLNSTNSLKVAYIPALRSARKFIQADDIFKDKIQQEYPELKDVEIFTGLEMYYRMEKLILGDRRGRKIHEDFLKYIGDNYFDGKTIDIISNKEWQCLVIKIGEEEEYPVHNLGDGIQHLIIITFLAFYYAGENLLLFIEEPELYLHPGMQRKLIEVLMTFENHQYFIATHSNHLLDMTLDVNNISVFTFDKKLEDTKSDVKKAVIRVENVSNDDNHALELLGVNNSSVFLSNCTIWVEGITDRLYFRHYFNIYQKYLKQENTNAMTFKEDTHFSFVEYGGSNITHWLVFEGKEKDKPINVKYLCSKLFLISDNDNPCIGTKKEELHAKIEKYLGDRYYKLESKEVENLVSEKVLKEVVKTYEKGTVLNCKHDEYKSKPLGSYIEDKLGGKNQKKYKADSGTINDKIDFCAKAREHTKSVNDLSEEAKTICEKIYNFIKEQNHIVAKE